MKDCGTRTVKPKESTNTDARIVGGYEATPHSQPWIVRLIYEDEISGESITACGGTLISSRHVVSNLNCFFDIPAFHMKVMVGVHSLSENEPYKKQYGIKNMYIYRELGKPEYTGKWNTLVLLKLDSDVQYNDHVSPICLPNPYQTVPKMARYVMRVSGWGPTIKEPHCCLTKRYCLHRYCAKRWEQYCRDDYERDYCSRFENKPSDVLMTMNMTAVPIKQCEDLAIGPVIDSDYSICARSMTKGEDACYEDIGGNDILN